MTMCVYVYIYTDIYNPLNVDSFIHKKTLYLHICTHFLCDIFIYRCVDMYIETYIQVAFFSI